MGSGDLYKSIFHISVPGKHTKILQSIVCLRTVGQIALEVWQNIFLNAAARKACGFYFEQFFIDGVRKRTGVESYILTSINVCPLSGILKGTVGILYEIQRVFYISYIDLRTGVAIRIV